MCCGDPWIRLYAISHVKVLYNLMAVKLQSQKCRSFLTYSRLVARTEREPETVTGPVVADLSCWQKTNSKCQHLSHCSLRLHEKRRWKLGPVLANASAHPDKQYVIQEMKRHVQKLEMAMRYVQLVATGEAASDSLPQSDT